jgi:hypothetical protein
MPTQKAGVSMSDTVWPVEPGKGIGVVALGASRDEVVRRLADAGLELVDDEGRSRWTYVEEMDADVTFSEGSFSVVEEIGVSDERARLGPIDLIDEPVLKVIELLRIADEDTLWTLRSDTYPKEPSAGDALADSAGEQTPSKPTIEKLLSEGCLWIRSFGLGLELVYGDVLTVRLREPGDIPGPSYGSLTPEQRRVAGRPDLTSHLIGSPAPTAARSTPSRTSRFQILAGLALLLSMAIVVWQGIDYQRRWDNALAVDAVVIGVSPPPPDPFPDFFTIGYQDQQGQRHEAIMHHSEIFSLSKIGDKVQIQYLPEAPDAPLGPWGARSAGLDKYIPWGIGVIGAYIGLQFVAGIVSLIPSKKVSA